MLEIKKILDAIEDATDIAPTAFNSKTINPLPVINYLLYRDGDTGAVESWRLQTRVTAQTLKKAIEIDSAISKVLVSIGDEEVCGAKNIAVNGGGTLEDELTGSPQIITYYDITTKS